MQELDLVPKQCLLASENRDAASMLETFHIKICMGFFSEYDKRKGTTEA